MTGSSIDGESHSRWHAWRVPRRHIVVAFRVLLWTSLALAVTCAVLWRVREDGDVLVPVAGAASGMVIAWTLLLAWFVAGWCVVLVPPLWSWDGPWEEWRGWRWCTIWISLLPWVTVLYEFVDPRDPGLMGDLSWVWIFAPAPALAIVTWVLGPRNAELITSGLSFVLGMVTGIVAVLLTFFAFGLRVPEAAWYEGPSGTVIVEHIGCWDGPCETRWWRDGWVYRR